MQNKSYHYIALIGDIKSSKKIAEREAVQTKLNLILNSVNDEFRKDLASKFMITLGDEFQGILNCGSRIVYIIDKIERELYPLKIRFGVGIGEITTRINPKAPLGADGPAFYLARRMIDELKSIEKKNMIARSNIKIAIQNNESVSEIINTVFSLLSIIKNSWTPRRIEIINEYLKSGGTQEQAANILGINQSTVQKSLSSSNYYTYINALKTVSDIITDIGEMHDV